MKDSDIRDAAARLGKKGGSSTSEAKRAAARENGKLGGGRARCANCGEYRIGYIYLLVSRAGDFVKLGYTTTPKLRVQALNMQCLGCFPAAPPEEPALLARMTERRGISKESEYFTANEHNLALFKELAERSDFISDLDKVPNICHSCGKPFLPASQTCVHCGQIRDHHSNELSGYPCPDRSGNHFQPDRPWHKAPIDPNMNRATSDSFTCLRCGHQWLRRSLTSLPRTCPNRKCHSPYWQTEPRPPKAAKKAEAQP